MIILAAGLSAGLAVPVVLSSLNAKTAGRTAPDMSSISNETPARPAGPAPILAVLDPSSLVGKSPKTSPQTITPVPQTNTPGATGMAGLKVPPSPVPSVQPSLPDNEVAPDQADTPIDQADTSIDKEPVESGILTPALTDPILRPIPSHEPKIANILVGRGDTLINILVDAGSSRRDANNAIAALKPHFDIRKLRAGQKVRITTAPADEGSWQLDQISIKTSPDREVRISRSDDGFFNGEELVTQLQKSERFAGGEINSSLYLAADRDNVPANTIVGLIRIFSYGVDFQREIRPGDAYQVLYETYSDDTGKEVKQGDLLYAMLQLGSRNKALYRFKSSDGFVDYYDEKGRSIKRLLMRTPVDGARLSSGFGKRRHPILGYTKLHTGTDFAAPRGTPIMAAGDGILDYAGRKGGYGNYIRIRHNGTFSTAYAHMNGLAKGMKKGKRVRQGQVIGYVGTTGRSTGNHLHYEVRKNGKPVNPMGLRLPVGRELSGKNLKTFRRQVAVVRQKMQDASAPLLSERRSAPKASAKAISFTSTPFPGRPR